MDGVDPEHTESWHALLDRPFNPRHLINDLTGEVTAQVLKQGRSRGGNGHPTMTSQHMIITILISMT
jgi:hypothetical protein